MKILHLIYTHGVAGAEKYLKHLLPPLKGYGIQSHLILVCPPQFSNKLSNYVAEMENLDIPITVLEYSKTGFFSAAKEIAAYTKHHHIEFLHSHLINSDVLAVLVKKFYNRNITLISTKHGYNEKILQKITDVNNLGTLKYRAMLMPYYFIAWLTLKLIPYNFAVSKAMAVFYKNIGFTKTVMPFIHHGVSVNVNNNLDKQELGSPMLLIIGRLESYKGHQYLLKAMPYIISHFPKCKLIVLGEGKERNNLEALAHELGITNNIAFMGFNTNPYSYIKAADVVVTPSLFEPFGLVFIEAIALAKPVVAFDVPAGNEILTNGVTGLLVPRCNINLLAETITGLLQNQSLRETIGTAAYEHFLKNFTTNAMVQNTALYYKKLYQ